MKKERSQQASKPASQQASKPASQQASKPASQQASKPASQQASKPASQQASKPASQLLEQIHSIEPSLFDKKGHLIFDKFKAFIETSESELSQESYTLNWLGKSYAKARVYDGNPTLLAAHHAHNQQQSNSQNLLIQGDNLAVLKHLQEAYREQVKMIYIDPPYNTGSDGFVYCDDRKYTPAQISAMTGEDEDTAERIFAFINRQSSSHSAWLTFMYPRLKIARELLREDGVIFISIDDNEQAQLKMLCDEVFGEENVECLIWNKEASGSSGTLKQISTTKRVHEYVLCAYKNIQKVQFSRVSEPLEGREDEFQTANLAVNKEKEKSTHKNYYSITNPNGIVFTRQWKWDEKTVFGFIKENLIYWGSDGNKQPRLIIPTDHRRKAFLLSILNYGGTTQGGKDFSDTMLEKVDFSYPKPLILLKKIINTSTNSSDLILDFFAGSGTTAHAVMQLNAEDGGNRRYICVQLDEKTDPKSEAHKAGYQTIFDITKARIEKAAAKIHEEHPGYQGDLGFQEFKLIDYPQHYGAKPETPQQGELLAELDLDNSTLQAILSTWCVNDGLPLTEQAITLDLNGYTAYHAQRQLYLLNKGFNSRHLAEILRRLDDVDDGLNIERIVVLGHHFDSKTQRELAEAVNQYKPRKGNQLYLAVRYE